MKLLTKEIERKLESLGRQDVEDPLVVCKWFNPVGSQTWYVIAREDQDRFFTYVTGMMEDELGYTSLRELENLRLPYGMHIERDRNFSACRLSDIKTKRVR